MFVHMFTFDLHHSQHKYHALFSCVYASVCMCARMCVYVFSSISHIVPRFAAKAANC